jgi:hypothetical protein
LGTDLISLNGAYSSTNGIITNAYYYFYNMLFKSLGCSNGVRVPVVLSKPTITQSGTSLTASYGLKYKWYADGVVDVTNETKIYNPSKSGVYKVEIISPSGCVSASADFNYVLSAIKPSDAAEIGLNVYPIPTKGVLNLSFDVVKKENIEIKVNNIVGQEMLKSQNNNFSGKFNQALDLKALEEGTYILSLKIGSKYYTQKFVVAK